MESTMNINMTPAELIQNIAEAIKDAGVDEDWTIDEVVFSSRPRRGESVIFKMSNFEGEEKSVVVLHDAGRES